MAITYQNVQLHAINSNGEAEGLYPTGQANNVIVDGTHNESLPSNIDDLQKLVDNLKSGAFDNGDSTVFFIDAIEDSEYDDVVPDIVNN